jgi:hypothetical protein
MIAAVHIPVTMPLIPALGYLALLACFALVYLYAAMAAPSEVIAEGPTPGTMPPRKPRVYRSVAMVDAYPLRRVRG